MFMVSPMAQTLTSEQIRELDDDEFSLLAWHVYIEHNDRLYRRRRQMRPLGIALNIIIAAMLYAYFGATQTFGVALVLVCLLGALADHLINWYNPQYLLARAEYLTLERERKALVAQIRRENRREESAHRWATLKRWLLGRR
jgi:hypothetical protein